jgi:hypothetical protein
MKPTIFKEQKLFFLEYLFGLFTAVCFDKPFSFAESFPCTCVMYKGICMITLVNTIFVTRNVECDSYVTFYAEFKNVIRIFLSPIGFV